MTNETLTDKEAQALFNDISKSIKDEDFNKIAELTANPAPDELKVPAPIEEPEVPDKVKSDETDNPPDDKAGTDGVPDDEGDPSKVEDTELAKLRAELTKVAKENHALKSQAGRVPHVQKRLQELDKKLEELTKGTSPSSQSSTKINDAVLEKLKGISETDPELAKAVADAIATAQNGLLQDNHSRTLAETQAARDAELEAYRTGEYDRLVEMYPNAVEVFKSPSYTEWKGKQSQQILALAKSDNADDVSFVFDRYAADMRAAHPELANEAAAGNEAAEKAKQVEAERLRKKQTTATVGSPNASGKVPVPEDAAALFKKFSEQIHKERLGL